MIPEPETIAGPFPEPLRDGHHTFRFGKCFTPFGPKGHAGRVRPIPARLLGHGKPVDALLDSAARNGLPPALRVHRSPALAGPSTAFPPPRPSAGNRVAIPTTGPDREVISRVSAEAWRMERLPPVGGVNVKRPTPSSAWGSGSMGVRQPGRSVGVAVAITRRYRNWSRLLRRPDFRHLPRHNGSLCLPPRLAHVITGRWTVLG